MDNKAYSTEPQFVAACAKAREAFGLSLEPSAAQASKYRRGFGAAYNAEHGRPAGSKVDMKGTRPEALEAQRATGRVKAQEYGPYSASPNRAPSPKKK